MVSMIEEKKASVIRAKLGRWCSEDMENLWRALSKGQLELISFKRIRTGKPEWNPGNSEKAFAKAQMRFGWTKQHVHCLLFISSLFK